MLAAMAGTALLLVLLSATVHAGWNLLGKKRTPDLAGMTVAAWICAAALLPALALWPGRVPALLDRCGWWLPASGLCHAAYYAALAPAYRHAALSTAYPLARALPVVLVAGWVAMLSGCTSLASTPPWTVALVCLGCASVALPALRSGGGRGGLWWGLLPALPTTAYSLVDDRCLRLAVAGGDARTIDSLLATALIYLLTAVFLTLPRLAARAQLRAVLAAPLGGEAMAMGVGIAASYALVLAAMPLAPDAGWITAVRQAGIPIGALLGFTLCREPATLARLAGLGLICAGLGGLVCARA